MENDEKEIVVIARLITFEKVLCDACIYLNGDEITNVILQSDLGYASRGRRKWFDIGCYGMCILNIGKNPRDCNAIANLISYEDIVWRYEVGGNPVPDDLKKSIIQGMKTGTFRLTEN